MKYRCVNKGKSAEMFIYGPIGGWFGGVTREQVAADLRAMGSVETINIRIDSEGGEVFEGFNIYNQLLRHPARKIVDIDAACCSIASVIACAGDVVRMARNSCYMIHEPTGGWYGTAAELRSTAARLDDIRDQLIETYQKKTGLAVAELSDMIAAETWLRASHAAQLGFVDEVTDQLPMAACANLTGFRNVPDWVAKQMNVIPMPQLAARAARMKANGIN